MTWGGYLPATADSIARYLAEHADTLAVNTLRQRLAALAQWHVNQGFPDPTKSPQVTTAPEYRLYRKAAGQSSKLCHMGHLLMENRNGFIVAPTITPPSGTAEREAAEEFALNHAEGRDAGG